MIDIHTHPVQIAELVANDRALQRAVREVFGLYVKPQPMATFFGQLDEAGIDRAVLLPIDCTTAHGCEVVSNEQIVSLVERSPRFIGFASVDPRRAGAVDRLQHAVREYRLCGLKLDPALQQFELADRELAFPIYRACVELDIPVLVHCGLSWAPLGRSSLARPLALEDVVQEFPQLRLVIAHFGWPWVSEAVMLALKHRNVYLDTSVLFSGTPSDSLRQALTASVGLDTLDRSLRNQLVFGSNYPRVDPKRVVKAVRDLGLRPELEKHIFHENAVALLKLEGQP